MIGLELTFLDIALSTFYLVLILFIAKSISSSQSKKFNSSYTKHMFNFVLAKLIGAILFSLLHIYIYKGGDTLVYFNCSKFYLEQIFQDPLSIGKLFSLDYQSLKALSYNKNFIGRYYLQSNDVRLMAKIGSFFCFLGFKQFMATNIIVSTFSCLGIWKIYSVMSRIAPRVHHLLAIGILYYPTTLIWSSGLLKDTLCIAAIGYIFWASTQIVIRKNYTKSILLIIASIYTCLILKPYILYTFTPVILLWIQDSLTKKIKNKYIKLTIKPFILGSFVLGAYLFISTVSESAGKYSLENVQSVAQGFHDWHTYLADTRGQSGYSLGNVNFTTLGILIKSPEAFFVTYYRPFVFIDTRNFATIFESIQSLVLLILTIVILIRVGLFKTLKLIASNHHIRAFFIFSVIFGVTVGLTSYNFGALSRYKIPALPFYTTSLILIYYFGYLKNKLIHQTT